MNDRKLQPLRRCKFIDVVQQRCRAKDVLINVRAIGTTPCPHLNEAVFRKQFSLSQSFEQKP